MCVRLRVCVYVCEGEREREREGGGEIEREGGGGTLKERDRICTLVRISVEKLERQ